MGFLTNSSVGFSNINVSSGGSGGGSEGASNIDVVYKETSTTLLSTEQNVASKAASSNISYTLPSKGSLNEGIVFEVINMNQNYTITVIDSQDSNIDGQGSFVVGIQSNISFVLDKANSKWRAINGI